MNVSKEKIGLFIIAILCALTVIAFLFSDPIPQDVAYHNFSDAAKYLGVPNALNVLSNLPFFVLGIVGVYKLTYNGNIKYPIIENNKQAYVILCLGTALVGLGSGFYHLSPNNNSILWDRLPMTLAFMSLYSIIIAEFISEELGKLLLLPLVGIGVMSVLYWWYTDTQGHGDLRYYAVVQFFPVLTIPVILFCFTSRFTQTGSYWVLLFTYLLAKLFEHYDVQIHQFLYVVSGHTLKHIAPAVGIWLVLNSYCKRDLVIKRETKLS